MFHSSFSPQNASTTFVNLVDNRQLKQVVAMERTTDSKEHE